MSNYSNMTAGFIDVATFDELEKYMYGSELAYTYFHCQVKHSTWFTLVPTVLTKSSGNAAFGNDWSVSISRSGDYLLHTWLRANVSSVTTNTGEIRWTHNFAHNLIKSAGITFNDLTAMQFDNFFLDFWAAFTVPASKQIGYNNMIGNTEAQFKAATTLPAFTINLPLPFFFSRDSGLSLPTAALPYNEMRIAITFRDWTELLVYYPPGSTVPQAVPAGAITNPPVLKDGNVWAQYAIVSNDERKRMGCAPRDILVEQVQSAPRATFKTNQSNPVDIRFAHAVKVLLFGVRNATVASEWSNYTLGTVGPHGYVPKGSRIDPMSNATLLYENTQRLSGMPSDYYSLVEPWYKAPAIPALTGYHMYSYSLSCYDVDPKGSTNYGKLTNVTLEMQGQQVDFSGTLQTVIIAVNHNIIRVSGGALGFPVL
jgi:hypothetical protein